MPWHSPRRAQHRYAGLRAGTASRTRKRLSAYEPCRWPHPGRFHQVQQPGPHRPTATGRWLAASSCRHPDPVRFAGEGRGPVRGRGSREPSPGVPAPAEARPWSRTSCRAPDTRAPFPASAAGSRRRPGKPPRFPAREQVLREYCCRPTDRNRRRNVRRAPLSAPQARARGQRRRSSRGRHDCARQSAPARRQSATAISPEPEGGLRPTSPPRRSRWQNARSPRYGRIVPPLAGPLCSTIPPR